MSPGFIRWLMGAGRPLTRIVPSFLILRQLVSDIPFCARKLRILQGLVSSETRNVSISMFNRWAINDFDFVQVSFDLTSYY